MADNNMGIQGTFAERRNEKELNKLRSGKSDTALMVTAVAGFFIIIAAFSGDPSRKITFLVAGVIPLIIGIFMNIGAKNKGKRINAYESVANRAGNTSIYDLAAASGRDVEKAIADIQFMISKGFFPGAYVDKENMLLVMTRDGKAIESVEASAAADKSARRKAARAKGVAASSIEDLLLMTDDDVIKGKLTTIQGLIDKIDAKAAANPALEKQVKEFRDQFVPSVVKMTDNFNTLDKDAVPEDVEKIKSELIDLLDRVIESCENLIDKLYEAEILDITTDIKSLQTTLASRGLLDSDFDVKL